MKAKAILLCLGLISIALGAQDSIRFSRHLKLGDQDAFKLHVTGSAGQGDVEFLSKTKEVISKIYDNGDADLTTTVTEVHVTYGGNEVPFPTPAPSTSKIDKNGTPMDAPGGMQGGLQFSRYMSGIFDKDIKVGDTINIDIPNAKDAKKGTTGTIKFDSITDGVAKLVGNVTAYIMDADTPSKIGATVYVNVGTARMTEIDGTVDSMPVTGGIVLTDVKFKLERTAS